jgi:peptidoglycan LD-endopeptidase CwlK
MSVDLNTLNPQFKDKVLQLLDACKAAGYEMVPTEGIRTPSEQGELWRQSRSAKEVEQEINNLKDHNCNFLAQCIENAGPHTGGDVTNAIPGLSWHQWGEAVDCVWIVNGKENWSTTELVNGKNGYAVYADLAGKFGLTAGGHWKSLKDWPHVQLPSAPSPSGVYSLQQINDIMKQRFGTTA